MTDQLRIEYDDDQISVIEKVNRALKSRGLVFVDDGLPHEGFCIFTPQAISDEDDGGTGPKDIGKPLWALASIVRERERLEAEVSRVLPVYEAAKEFRLAYDRPTSDADYRQLGRRLRDAMDVALAAEAAAAASHKGRS
jgi:hypothetical protein